jgi:hypothetical protein
MLLCLPIKILLSSAKGEHISTVIVPELDDRAVISGLVVIRANGP